MLHYVINIPRSNTSLKIFILNNYTLSIFPALQKNETSTCRKNNRKYQLNIVYVVNSIFATDNTITISFFTIMNNITYKISASNKLVLISQRLGKIHQENKTSFSLWKKSHFEHHHVT